MSSLGQQHVSRVELFVPRYGAWRVDVTMSNGEPPSGPAVATVGDLELHGTVLRSGLDAPGKPHAVVVGGLGWERALSKPLSYRSDVGVRLSTILKDLAALAGEPIEQPADTTIGYHFEVPASRGARVLLRDVMAALQRAGHVAAWRVDPDGVTRFGARAGATITARATVLRRDAGAGITVLGIDSPASFLPGHLLDGDEIERLIVRETAGKLEAEVWTS